MEKKAYSKTVSMKFLKIFTEINRDQIKLSKHFITIQIFHLGLYLLRFEQQDFIIETDHTFNI